MNGEKGIPEVVLGLVAPAAAVLRRDYRDAARDARKLQNRGSFDEVVGAKETKVRSEAPNSSPCKTRTAAAAAARHSALPCVRSEGKVPTVRVAFVFSVLLPLAPALLQVSTFLHAEINPVCACVSVCVHTSVSSESPGSYSCSRSVRRSLLYSLKGPGVTLRPVAGKRSALIVAGSFPVAIFSGKGFHIRY